MKRIANEKGITLIALIITIIVMLILVAVTISVALNGGLFDRARKASEDTQREADKEELVAAQAATFDSITKANLERELTDKWLVVDNEDGTLTCTKKSTNNSFTINGTTETDEDEINEYGFYFNKEYICNSYGGDQNDKAVVRIFSDGRAIANSKIKESSWTIGYSFQIVDMANVQKYNGNSLAYDTPYEFTGYFGENYTCIYKNDGYLHQEIVFSNLTFSNKKLIIAQGVEATFSEDGTSFTLNGDTYSME